MTDTAALRQALIRAGRVLANEGRNKRADLFKNVFDYAHQCACRNMGIDICEPIAPQAMQGRYDRDA